MTIQTAIQSNVDPTRALNESYSLPEMEPKCKKKVTFLLIQNISSLQILCEIRFCSSWRARRRPKYWFVAAPLTSFYSGFLFGDRRGTALCGWAVVMTGGAS